MSTQRLQSTSTASSSYSKAYSKAEQNVGARDKNVNEKSSRRR